MPPTDAHLASIDLHSVPAPDQANQQATQALDLLRNEARLHQQQMDQTSLLGRAVAGVSDFWHHSNGTGSEIDDLKQKIQADLIQGKSADAASLAGNAQSLVEADRDALKTRGEITQYGSAAVATAGLFMAGKKGFALAGAAAVLDAVKPGSTDSVGEQLTDVGLGVTRAFAMKGAFLAASKFNLGMATTAVGLGVGSRFGDVALSRQTYIDNKTGQYDAGLGMQRIVASTTDKAALATDIVTLIVARGALGKLNSATDGALTHNKLWSTMAVGGIFGVTQGSVSEVVRQTRAGIFDPGLLALRTLVSGATSMAGAAIGGAGMQRAAMNGPAMQDAAMIKAEGPIGAAHPALEAPLKISLNGLDLSDVRYAKPNFPGSTSREYQLINVKADVSGTMALSTSAFAYVVAREVKLGGALGPEQNLLVQHGGEGIALNTALAAKADIIATCDPSVLPSSVRAKHILPSVQGSLWLTQKPGGRLNFSERLAEALSPGEPQPVALGNRPVSEILRDPATLDKLNNKGVHDLGLYSDVLKGFKMPAKRVIIGGADSVVLELADDSILKITHQQWNPDWGHRTYRNAQGKEIQFDANIIGERHTFDRPDGMATYYIQERAKTPVSESSRDIFAYALDQDRRYTFWDRDVTQLGTVDIGNGQRALRLLDYDAVRPPHLVPKDLKTPHEDRFDREDRFGRY